MPAGALAVLLGVPRVVCRAEVGSTMDVAHALAAEGAPAGRQTGGRGRAGRRWSSPAGAGIWLTLLERPTDAAALGVLSLRVGLHAALALQPFADAPVTIKWPNDLQIARRKLAGVLVEARWRDAAPEWVAIGFGLNLRPPADAALPDATGLGGAHARPAVLAALVPALRAAAAGEGLLSADELRAYALRDAVAGRLLAGPVRGRVRAVAATGELVVTDEGGRETRLTQATLAFAD